MKILRNTTVVLIIAGLLLIVVALYILLGGPLPAGYVSSDYSNVTGFLLLSTGGLLAGNGLEIFMVARQKVRFQALESQRDTLSNEALCVLADYYHKGYGVEKDDGQAIELYLKAIEEKHIPAMYALGEVYFSAAKILSESYETAAEYFKMAADYGYKPAYLKLAQLYKKGIGVERSDEKHQYYLDRCR